MGDTAIFSKNWAWNDSLSEGNEGDPEGHWEGGRDGVGRLGDESGRWPGVIFTKPGPAVVQTS